MAVERILMFHMAVTDMAKAKEFYAEKLGFKVTSDYGQGDQHWVSLSAPGGVRLSILPRCTKICSPAR